MKLEELTLGLPETERLYWSDPYLRNFEGSLLETVKEGRRRVYLLLDRSVFHPKSGGQPSDRGRIYSSSFEVEVKKVMEIAGHIIHFGELLKGEGSAGENVSGELDWNWRYLLMKRHTAGHLLDHCLAIIMGHRVETTDAWHGDECYVGYAGGEPGAERIAEVEELENRLIREGRKVLCEVLPYHEALKRVPEAPNISRLPKADMLRLVTIEGCDPIPCGGTHVKDIIEMGRFELKEVRVVEDGFRVYYDVG